MRYLAIPFIFCFSLNFSLCQSAFIDVGESAIEIDAGVDFGLSGDKLVAPFIGFTGSPSGRTDLGFTLGRTVAHRGYKNTIVGGGFSYHFIKEYDVLPIGFTFNTVAGGVFTGSGNGGGSLSISSTFYKTSLKPGTRLRELYFYATTGYLFTSVGVRGSGPFLSSGFALNIPSDESSFLLGFGYSNTFLKGQEDPKAMTVSLSYLIPNKKQKEITN